ncbi:MAG TPA: hypothetical protein VFI74_00140 [Candidatus Saccharimonadales bacterium]|nr:hypothetical protein [Candidatus Saccharimonadales bacterium]
MKHETVLSSPTQPNRTPLAHRAAKIVATGMLVAATACSSESGPAEHLDPQAFTGQFEQMPDQAPEAVIKAAGATVRLHVAVPDYLYLGSEDTGVYVGKNEVVSRVYLGEPPFGLPDSLSVMAIQGNGKRWLNGSAQTTGPSAVTYSTPVKLPAYFRMDETGSKEYLKDVPAATISNQTVKPGDIVWQTGFDFSKREYSDQDYYSPQIAASVVVAANKDGFRAIPAALYGTASNPHKAQKITPTSELNDSGSPYFASDGTVLGVADQERIKTADVKAKYRLPELHGQKIPLDGSAGVPQTLDAYNEVDHVVRITPKVLSSLRATASIVRGAPVSPDYNF